MGETVYDNIIGKYKKRFVVKVSVPPCDECGCDAEVTDTGFGADYCIVCLDKVLLKDIDNIKELVKHV